MKKKYIKIVIFIIIMISVGGILLIKNSFYGWNDGTISQKEVLIKSNLGDEFKVNFKMRNFPDLDTSITVMDSKGNVEIAYFVIDGEFYESELKLLEDTSHVRCYQYYEQLIYQIDNNRFKAVYIKSINQMNPKETPEFHEVAKTLIAKKEWKWVEYCGKYLLESGDNDVRDMMERYAKGQFTQEELEFNKDAEITKEQMESFAKQVISYK